MSFLSVLFIRTFIFYFLLTLLMRLMGKRQLGELQITELIIALMLSDIAVVPITDPDIPLLHGIVPALALTSFELIMSYVCTRSRRIRRFIAGSPIILMSRGKVNEESLDATHVTMDELFSELRIQGYADIKEIEYIIFEPSGKLSLIPFSRYRTLTPTDLGINVKNEGIAHPVIIDGAVNEDALRGSGKSIGWLFAKLRQSGTSPDEILYMTVDDNGHSNVRLKKRKKK